jgi:hypothetical protein
VHNELFFPFCENQLRGQRLAVAKALILLLMAGLEPWTSPMTDNFRGHKEAFRFFFFLKRLFCFFKYAYASLTEQGDARRPPLA